VDVAEEQVKEAVEVARTDLGDFPVEEI